jgi:WD40 repeat protein
MMCRHMEVDKEVSAHEQLHLRPVTCVDLSADGELIVTGQRTELFVPPPPPFPHCLLRHTGSSDRSVRLWRFSKYENRRSLRHQVLSLPPLPLLSSPIGNIQWARWLHH